MLGDPTLEISRNFDTLREGQGLADRSTFLVDPDGVIQFLETTAEGIGRNAAELLRKVKAAQYVASPPRRGLPRHVGRGRRDPGTVAGPRRQDLSRLPPDQAAPGLAPRGRAVTPSAPPGPTVDPSSPGTGRHPPCWTPPSPPS